MESLQLYRRQSEVTESSVGDQLILFQPASQKALVVNSTGGWVWSRLAEPQHLSGLADQLQQHYPELDRATTLRDLSTYLEQMQAHSVVVPVG